MKREETNKKGVNYLINKNKQIRLIKTDFTRCKVQVESIWTISNKLILVIKNPANKIY